MCYIDKPYSATFMIHEPSPSSAALLENCAIHPGLMSCANALFNGLSFQDIFLNIHIDLSYQRGLQSSQGNCTVIPLTLCTLHVRGEPRITVQPVFLLGKRKPTGLCTCELLVFDADLTRILTDHRTAIMTGKRGLKAKPGQDPSPKNSSTLTLSYAQARLRVVCHAHLSFARTPWTPISPMMLCDAAFGQYSNL